MTTHQIALACVFSASMLFSCTDKRSKHPDANIKDQKTRYDTVRVFANDLLDMHQYNAAFNNSLTQKFTASAKKITIITSAKGLKLTVYPSMLEKEDGSAVDGKISVQVIELTNSNDLFKSNAATVSNGRLLASGGSYFIGMECNGQKLRIKKSRTMQVDFPVLTKDEMELFYGERDDENKMNWQRAGVNLNPEKEEAALLSDIDRLNSDIPLKPVFFMNQLKLYKTLNEEVYYYNKKMTLKEIVDTINRYSKKVFIDTIYAWPKELANLPKGTRVDTNFLLRNYGPPHQFYLKTFKGEQNEKEGLAKQKALRDSMIAKWQPRSLSGQIQKYYQPSPIRALGWINCDRYYQREQTDVEVDLPITLNNNKIQFFLLFKSINGLMNLSTDTSSKKKIFRSLPVGEPVILIGFTKSNGEVFQCKEEFVILKNHLLVLKFKTISPGEMTKMFGKNVRI
jgi:hypothetical protein